MKHPNRWRILSAFVCALAIGLFALTSAPAPKAEAEAPTVLLVDDAMSEDGLLLAGQISSVSRACIKCPTILGECSGSPANKPCGSGHDCRCSTCGGEFDCFPCAKPPCF